jgi:hypothetical protein
MAVPTYGTDLSLIDDAQAVGSYSATGGGAGGLADETDYFINGSQCISKAGFTATTKGIIHDDVSAPTITSGDAVFIWARQANRNIIDTLANGGGQLIMGTSNANFDCWYVDGSTVDGSVLASWVTYAVDPLATPDATVGSPGTYDWFGFRWKILGSGSLKGQPNAVGVSRYGRELTCIDGQAAAYANFDGAAVFDSDSTRRWGILTPVQGGYWFHGAFVMGTTGTSTDFRDSDRNILVLDDVHAPSGFNEFEIRNSSSNVEWTNIVISHLGTNTNPSILTLNVGTFTGELCQFIDCSTTTFASTGSCIGTTWSGCDRVNLNEADLSGSSFLVPSVAADEGAVFDDRTTTGAVSISELDFCTFTIGAASHHAIRFGANVDDDITLTGIEFTGFSSTADATNATLRFDATTGTMNVNLVDCTVDGNPATTSNVGVDDAAGITVTLVVDPKTTKITVTEADGTLIENARVFLETADNGGGSGFPYEAATSTLTQAAGVATLTASAVHGLDTGDKVVVRGAAEEPYNSVVSITVTSTTVFTYAIDSGATTPAGGTPIFSYVPIQGLTSASGVIQSSKTWPAAQSLKGYARKSSASPYFKQTAINITDAAGGTDLLVTLQSDE